MFSKISRYRKLADLVTIDADGRRTASRDLRLLPEVTGQFEHVIEDRDRLDALAYLYYRQPRKWWRICDANPEFLAPQALLGKEPVVTCRIPLAFQGAGDPPWATLLQLLAAQVGVVNVLLGDDDAAIEVVFNRMNTSAAALAALIETQNFRVEQPRQQRRDGRTIIIPADGGA